MALEAPWVGAKPSKPVAVAGGFATTDPARVRGSPLPEEVGRTVAGIYLAWLADRI